MHDQDHINRAGGQPIDQRAGQAGRQHPLHQPIKLITPAALALDAAFPPLSMALCEVLLQRRSERHISDAELNLHQLSRLLWAAFGINRPAQSRRTAPAAPGMHEIEVYIALASGLYRYDPHANLLAPVGGDDIRADTGQPAASARAPLTLIFVATIDPGAAPGQHPGQAVLAALASGFISQNVYLFCAAEGLATAVHTTLDRQALARRLQLGPHEEVILVQPVGLPLSANDAGA